MEDFIKQLLQDKGVTDLAPETYNQLVSDLSARAADMVNKQVVESMNEDVLQEFEVLIDTKADDTQAVQDFIDNKVPNKEEIAAKALLEFRTLYLGVQA